MSSKYIDNGQNIKKINLNILISLLPLILYGFYKNGIKLYYLGLENILGMFEPLLFAISGFLVGLISSFIYDKFIKKKEVLFFKESLNTFYPLYGVLISSIISINTNYIVFVLVTFIVLFLSKFIKKCYINVVSLVFLIILVIMNISSSFTFLNVYEKTAHLHLEPIDYFLGMGSGGIFATCTILLILSFIILCLKNYYKKEIAIISISTYILCIFIYGLVASDLKLILESIFSNGLLFNLIYIAPLSMFSPCTYKGKIIYSVLIGIITFLLYLVKPELASIGAIFVLSLSSNILDKLVER